jgi:hypothetical protein
VEVENVAEDRADDLNTLASIIWQQLDQSEGWNALSYLLILIQEDVKRVYPLGCDLRRISIDLQTLLAYPSLFIVTCNRNFIEPYIIHLLVRRGEW